MKVPWHEGLVRTPRVVGTGALIHLGQVLAQGGEGTVYLIADDPSQVAKVYAQGVDEHKQHKLLALVQACNPQMVRIAAWPTTLLQDSNGICGFLMPRVDAAQDVHQLYTPRSRKREFPGTDFRFLVHVAANIARVFATIHERGLVVGDVNHSNLLVRSDATVTLIDCDSMQIRSGTTVHTCDVGTPEFTPPELQGRSLRSIVRTPDHDLFGLAVLLFHVLFMGRHPFIGRYGGTGDKTLVEFICEFAFFYAPGAASRGLLPPIGAPSLELVGKELGALFLRAFGREAVRAGRPPAAAWVAALDRLRAQLIGCQAADRRSTAALHVYPRHLTTCPWCEIESRQPGLVLFPGQACVVRGAEAVNLNALWEAIVSVPPPSPDPPLPDTGRWRPPNGVRVPNVVLSYCRKGFAAILACCAIGGWQLLQAGSGWMSAVVLGLALALWPWVSSSRVQAALAECKGTEEAWQTALRQWAAEATTSAFTARVEQLRTTMSELNDLPNERTRRLVELERTRESRELHEYLQGFVVESAYIPGVGVERKSRLAQSGILTAADVNHFSVIRIYGFGDILTSQVVAWRDDCATGYRFDPLRGLHPADVAALDQALEERRRKLLTDLSDGPEALRRLTTDIYLARSRLMPEVKRAWDAYQVARIRRSAL